MAAPSSATHEALTALVQPPDLVALEEKLRAVNVFRVLGVDGRENPRSDGEFRGRVIAPGHRPGDHVTPEPYGFLPPHPAAPPPKRPLVALMKQARAYGVGVVIATQNPMDLDYRALSNAGLWCLGRLQTDADRERVIEGLTNEASHGATAEELSQVLKRLAPRWFVVRDAHAKGGPVLMQPRWAMSLLRGPMTRAEIRRARAA